MRTNRERRAVLRAGAAALLASAAAGAAWPQSAARRPAGGNWRLLVNEAFTGDTNVFLLAARYRQLADAAAPHFRGRIPLVEPVVDIERFMQLALAESKPELVFGKSVNQLAKLVRDHGYLPLVRRDDPYKAAFIVPSGSPIRNLADAAKARILMPEQHTATTALALAELRNHHKGPVDIVHIRYQEAVAQQLQNGFAQVGVVNPTVARKWVESGGRLLAETRPVVNWSVLASPGTGTAAVHELRDAFLAMGTEALAAVGVKKWAPAQREDYLALLQYTGE
jgi:hypothetical protein